MPKVTHYYVPERAARTYGNVRACCTRPPEDHPEFVEGDAIIVMKRDARFGDTVFRKGETYKAEARIGETFRIAKESRWGTNVLGQFAELERAELEKVALPGYTIWLRDKYGCGIPVQWARRVA